MGYAGVSRWFTFGIECLVSAKNGVSTVGSATADKLSGDNIRTGSCHLSKCHVLLLRLQTERHLRYHR